MVSCGLWWSAPFLVVGDCETVFTHVWQDLYQDKGEFLRLGDYNSRVGDRQDFVEGIDKLCEREIIDTKKNAYSDIFVDFLVSANCVMLHGRDNIKKNTTQCQPEDVQ